MHYHRPSQRSWMFRPSKTLLAICLSYTLAIVYASLYPLSNWRAVDVPLWLFLTQPWPRYWTAFDLISNTLAYIPLAALLSLYFWPRLTGVRNVILATTLCALLSLGMEITQHFLPKRVPSWVDIATNIMGALIGATIAASFAKQWFESQFFDSLTSRWLRAKPVSALILLLVWVAIQALPQSALFLGHELPLGIFGLALEQWRDQLQTGYLNLASIIVTEALTVSLTFFVLAALLIEVTTVQAPRLALGICLVLLALTCKVLGTVHISHLPPLQWLTIGGQSGLVVGAVVALIAAGLPQRIRLRIAALAVVGLIGMSNFLPLDSYQISAVIVRPNSVIISLTSFLRVLAISWPWLALLYVLSRKIQRRL